MDFTDIANKYFELGLSIIPVDEKKQPIGKWKQNTQSLIKPNGVFANCHGIGLVCGVVSGGIEVVDIDEKYSLDGKLFKEYKALINSIDPDLLKKLVVSKTQGGGYHFIYKCLTIDGNKKLASRYTTDDEKITHPQEKVKVLIETRGENGYIKIPPSPNYDFIYQDFSNIQYISKRERELLLDCAKTFNEVYDEPIVKKEHQEVITNNLSPFEDWNKRGDVLELLLAEGWKLKLQRGTKNLLLRPGGTGNWSADWDSERRLFYVWTSSSEFESGKAFNAIQVLSTLKFNKDYSATAKWLLKNGYGSYDNTNIKKEAQIPVKSKLTDTDLDSFIATDDELDSYITQIRNGTFVMGKTTGIPSLDRHWLFKETTFCLWLGFDNIGKTIFIWFLAALSAILHDWKWIIYSSENKTGAIKRKIIEYYSCKNIQDLSEAELKEGNKWFNEHFTIIKNKDLYTYKEILEIGSHLCQKGQKNAFMIDPYNGLDKDTTNEHQYDYRAMNEMRLWIDKNKCCIYLNIHAVTEALRKKHIKGHPLEGYPMPPHKADAEGGGKFTSKGDDFSTLHRYVQHPDIWNTMEIHVHKIKEMESGGKHTFLDEPVKLKMVSGSVGYVDEFGINPIEKFRFNSTKVHEETPYESQPITPNTSIDFSEPKYQDIDDKPF